MLLENKTAVIYGAGGAIGAAVAHAFAREGATLILTGRNDVDALDERAVEEHLDTVGPVDISFNAVGPGPAAQRVPLTEMSADAFARPIDFYTRANFITATAAARHGAGVIIMLTAVPGRLPAPMVGGQAPAWAAVEALSRALALELGIRVVCLRCHAIPETPLIEANFATAASVAGVTPAEFRTALEQRTLLGRLPTLAEVADTAAFVASDRAGAITGTVVNLSAGAITD
jgi:NAD(P)-dependent dehydrogenase (short-subunit alcohol dehydrogenase family)